MLDNRLTRVQYRNFMSFADEEVDLGDLIVLVGPNGSGKSNFIEGLRFLRDALRIGLDTAVANRGGIELVRRKRPGGRGRPPDMEIRIEGMAANQRFSYGVSIAARAGGDWHVRSERCRLAASGTEQYTLDRDGDGGFTIQGPEDDPHGDSRMDGGRVDPKVFTLQLAGRPFHRIVTLLRNLGTFNIYPDTLRQPQRLLEPRWLQDDGRNLASLLRRLRDRRHPAADRIRDALADLIPGVSNFKVSMNGGYASISLALNVSGKDMWFDASQVSDGTLRLLGIATAIHQWPAPSLIAIEEPELTVHPGAAVVLTDELVEAAQRTQILVTTHSPDIVARMPVSALRVVEATEQGTRIDSVSANQVDAVNKNLFSAGDLIRVHGLRRELHVAG